MAIETHCPNGHRVRVREELAGKTGRCPTCGTSFRLESSPELPVARLVSLDPAIVATLPRARPLGSGPAQPAAAVEPPVASPAVVAGGGETIGPEVAANGPSPLHPVIAERPDVAWCIAFPGGDPTEPLDPQTMQAWLDGGHATGTEVVWRADWTEWRPIQEVFPSLFGGDFRF